MHTIFTHFDRPWRSVGTFLETQNPFFKSGAISAKLATFVPHVTRILEQVALLGFTRLVDPLSTDPEPIYFKKWRDETRHAYRDGPYTVLDKVW